jgi:thiamine biosynthesis lipoprotein
LKNKKLASIAFLLVVSSLLTTCLRERTVELSQTRPLLGTVIEIKIFTGDKEAGEKAIEDAFSRIAEIEKRMSNFLPSSELSRVNEKAGEMEVKLSLELSFLIERGLLISEETEGAFDLTVSPLLRLWGFYRHQGRIPKEEEIRDALTKTGWEKLIYNPKEKTIRFREKGMALDSGGIAKGYAVDQAIAALKKHGINRALVNAGGDIYALGGGRDNNSWLIGIAHPRDEGNIIGRIRVRDKAVVTSGSYQNYFEIGGKRYCHIIDPRTGYPVTGMASVTIIADDVMIADALATAVFVSGREKGLSLIEELPDIEGIIITDGEKMEVYFSSGMKEFHPGSFPSGLISVVEKGSIR